MLVGVCTEDGVTCRFVSIAKLVAHGHDVVGAKLTTRMGIKHCRLIDVLHLACCRRFNGEKLAVDIGHIHCRKLYGESSHLGGCDAVFVHKTRHFYASICREIFNKSFVDYVSAYLVRRVCNYRFHYARSVLARAYVLQSALRHELLLLIRPSLYLSDTASRIFVQRNVEPLDKLRIAILDVKHVVFNGCVLDYAVNVKDMHYLDEQIILCALSNLDVIYVYTPCMTDDEVSLYHQFDEFYKGKVVDVVDLDTFVIE